MLLNQYPRWKNLLVLIIVMLGALYALPNFFGDDPAVQVSALGAHQLDAQSVDDIEAVLAENNIPYEIERSDERILVRFTDPDNQLIARDLIAQTLGEDTVVALNLAPATPDWLRWFAARPMKLGLDLRGGVHFLLELDTVTIEKRRLDGYADDIRSRLREADIRYRGIEVNSDNQLVVRFQDEATRSQAQVILRQDFPGLDFNAQMQADNYVLSGEMTEFEQYETLNYAVDQSMTTLRNRVNELGVSEALVQRQGAHRIVVELPGVQDTAMAKDILGKTATLEFRLVEDQHEVSNAVAGYVPPGTALFYDRQGVPYLLKQQIVLAGDSVVGAQSGFDEFGQPAVFIQLGGDARMFSRVTGQNVGQQMATVYIESRFVEREVDGEVLRTAEQDYEIISVATIRSALGNRFQITGLTSADEARTLALLLRAGALPAPIDIVEERTVGPSLGADNIAAGVLSIQVGLVLVLLCMIIFYRSFGVIATIALVVNLILIMAILSVLGATLTLPGIAGIVLTLGMAVDANVLIFERIRDEIRNGNTPQASIHAGFEKAFTTIIDAQLTTFIAALALFSLGSGPVKGFAVTLIIGLITSVFTAVVVSRAIVNKWYGQRSLDKLSIGL